MDAGDALIGRTLGGTFRIDRVLGEGGMGAVYAATHARTGRRYAVKVLLPEVAARKDAVARFRREADAVGALGHANIVAIHDFHEDEGLAYLVMDLLEGEDLAARLERQGPLSLDSAIAIFAQMSSGLDAAHARGLIHRDLKPANVFLARQPGAPERVVLLDFGLARSFARDGDLAKLTSTGVVLGTPQYMSPEQAAGETLDARADLYALATILFEMLAGVPPFSAPTLPALFAKLVTDPPPPLSRERPDLPPALSDVLSRALAKHPDERYPDASALREAVERAITGVPHTQISGVPIAAARPAAAAPSAAHRGRPTWFLALAITFVGLAAIAGGVGALAIFAANDPTPREIAAVAPIRMEEVVVDLPPPAPPPAPIEIRLPPPPQPEPEPVIAPAPRREPAQPRPEAPPREDRTSSEPPPRAPADGPPADAPPADAPPAGGPPAGVREATDRMAESDWAGCIRATHAAPRSAAILGARMSCAIRANDDDELRATCAELRQHYPQHGYTSSCASILATRR